MFIACEEVFEEATVYPLASFELSKSFVEPNDTFYITNSSENQEESHWNFGETKDEYLQIDTDEFPYFYAEEGIYKIILQAKNEGNVSEAYAEIDVSYHTDLEVILRSKGTNDAEPGLTTVISYKQKSDEAEIEVGTGKTNAKGCVFYKNLSKNRKYIVKVFNDNDKLVHTETLDKTLKTRSNPNENILEILL